jgi:hypothetical protein
MPIVAVIPTGCTDSLGDGGFRARRELQDCEAAVPATDKVAGSIRLLEPIKHAAHLVLDWHQVDRRLSCCGTNNEAVCEILVEQHGADHLAQFDLWIKVPHACGFRLCR